MKNATNMWLDGHPSNNPSNTTRENTNIVVTDEIGTKISEYSVTEYSNYNKHCIGEIILNNNEVILFNSDGSFGILKEEIYTQLYTGLNVSSHTTIRGEYIINSNGNRVIIFLLDGTPKYVNIDKPITNIELFNIDFNLSLAGYSEIAGNLYVGGYIPIFRLLGDDLTPTNWIKDLTSTYIANGNNKSETLSNKGLRFHLEGINTNYAYLEYGYVSEINGIKQAYISGKRKITQSIETIDITLNSTNAINTAEVIEDKAVYKRIEFIARHQNYLYGLGIENYHEQNNQSIVNNINVKWTSKLITTINDNKLKSFAHGEVYALTIKFRWKWGYGRRYPLIGRSSVATDTADVNGSPKWKVQETCSITGIESGYTVGDFSYIENTNENYKSNVGLPNGKVRYFKFPSINYIKNNLYNNDNDYGCDKLDLLGIKIENLDLNNILDSDGNTPIDYKIEYAKRTLNNSSVVGQSIAILNTKPSYGQNNNKRISVGGNFAEGANIYDKLSFRVYAPELLSGDFEVDIDQVNLELDLRTDFLQSNNEIFTTIGKDQKASKYDFEFIISDYRLGESYALPETKLDVTDIKKVLNNTILNNIDNIFGEEHISINTNTAIPIPVVNATLDPNRVAVQLLSTLQEAANNGLLVTNGYENTILVTLIDKKDDYYFNLESNIFTSLTNEGNGFFNNADVFLTYVPIKCYRRYTGADVTNVDYSQNSDKQGQNDGGVYIKYFLCESVYNTKHLINEQVNHFPKIELNTVSNEFINSDKTIDPNLFRICINKDFSISNELEQQLFFNTDIEDYNPVDKFTIIRSFKDNERIFDKDDIASIPRNKGVPTNFIDGKDRLYIHTEDSLFVTRGGDRAINDTQNNLIYLGVGDIFDSPIQEIQHSKLGLLGTQHAYSCVTTPFGYCFVDQEKKAVINVSDNSLDILSDKGVKNFFFSSLKGKIYDNPYAKNSIQIQYDEEFKRLIVNIDKIGTALPFNHYNSFEELKTNITVTEGGIYKGVYYKKLIDVEEGFVIESVPLDSSDIFQTSQTLIYSFITQGWTSYSTINVERMIRLRNLKLLSTLNNKLYLHNDKESNLIFNGIQQECQIQFVFPTIQDNRYYTVKKVLWNFTLPYIIHLYNDLQNTGEILLREKNSDITVENFSEFNVRKNKTHYHFYAIKDKVTKALLHDSYVILRFKHNKSEQLKISDVNIELHEQKSSR